MLSSAISRLMETSGRDMSKNTLITKSYTGKLEEAVGTVPIL